MYRAKMDARPALTELASGALVSIAHHGAEHAHVEQGVLPFSIDK